MSDPTDPRLHLAWVEKNRKKEKGRRKALKRSTRPRRAAKAILDSTFLPKTTEGFLKVVGMAYRIGWWDALASLAAKKKARKP
jgi:hypothetical protein